MHSFVAKADHSGSRAAYMCSANVRMVIFIQWYSFYETQEYETPDDTVNKIQPMKNCYYPGISLTKYKRVFMAISTKGYKRRLE